MRIRICLLPPFQPAKILLAIPSSIQTISRLKKHLHRSLSSIANLTESYKDLKLEIEGFELLNGSDLNVIIDDDVLSSVPSPLGLSGIDKEIY